MIRRKWLVLMLSVLAYNIALAQKNYPGPLPAATNIVRLEYFFDRDPGQGKATQLNVAAAKVVNNHTTDINLDVPGLSKGAHILYIRSQDASGKWSLTANSKFSNFAIPAYPTVPASSTITGMEYFIDVDPGAGKATKIAIAPAKDLIGQAILVNLDTVAKGPHVFYLRTRDAAGKWSMANINVFDYSGMAPYPSAPAKAEPVVAAEYFIDTDPGFGKGTAIKVNPSVNIQNVSVDVPLGGLKSGRHYFYLRSKESPWSMTSVIEFIYGSVLPLRWTFLTGENKNEAALISWGTSAEMNTSSFSIEHSTDGTQFKSIGTLEANGSNSSDNRYAYLHKDPKEGFNFYRIHQVDKDGRSSYSKVIRLLFKKNKKGVILAPNPVMNEAFIIQPAEAYVKTYMIYDAAGRMINQQWVNEVKAAAWPVDLSTLAKGAYTISIEYKDRREVIRFVKK